MIPDRVTRAGEIGGSGWPIDEEPGALERLSEVDRRIHALAQSDRAAAIPLAEQRAAEWVTPLKEHPESIMDERTTRRTCGIFDDAAGRELQAITEGVRIGPRCTLLGHGCRVRSVGFALEDVTIEFHLWHGAHDPAERQSSVAFWAARIPGARVTVFEDSGHFAVVDHWGEMLSAVTGKPG